MIAKPTVLLTSSIHPDGEAILAPHVSTITAPDARSETLRDLVHEVDGIIVRDKLPADIFDGAPRLRGVVRHGVGLDFIPVEEATRRGIPVANLPGSNTGAVAEYCFSAMMHLRRPLGRFDARHRTDGWASARAMTDDASELGGSVLGILGVGNIGRKVAQIGRVGFGMHVLGTSRRSGNMPEGIDEVSVEDLFRRSDVVVLSCALTDATRGIVDDKKLRLMKPGAVLINVSRGPVIQSQALLEALMSGRLAGACIDVYDNQPLPADSPFFAAPNLIMTPHTASLTSTTTRAMSIGAAEEMLRCLRGETPLNLVNPD